MDIYGWIGWAVAVISGSLNILQYRKNRVGLKINLMQEEFISEAEIFGEYRQNEQTQITINADIKTRGLEEITISEIELITNNKEINNRVVKRSKSIIMRINNNQSSIRLKGNDRQLIRLYCSLKVFLPYGLTHLPIRLIFKTPHKDIHKEMRLIRKFTPKQIEELKKKNEKEN